MRRLSDQLKEERDTLLTHMTMMSETAANENRLFTGDEERAFEVDRAAIKALDKRLEVQCEAERLARGDRGDIQPIGPNVPRLVAEDGTVLRALKPEEKLADLVRGRPSDLNPNVSIADVVRGIVKGDWRDVGRPLQRAVGETGDSVFPVPEYISNTWIDAARSQATAFRSGAITVPMRSETEKIISVTQDATFTWRKEHRPLAESDVGFAPIKLEARLCGALVRTSIEVLEDSSPSAQSIIETTMQRAMAVQLDWALLAAQGDRTGDLNQPIGLMFWPGIPTEAIAAPMTNYDGYVDAATAVLNANGEPTAMISNSGLAGTFNKIKAGVSATDMNVLEPPPMIDALPRYYTSTMPAGASVVGDFSMLAWGLRTGATLEVTRTGGDGTFKQLQTLVRLYFRGDTAVLRPSWFAKTQIA